MCVCVCVRAHTRPYKQDMALNKTTSHETQPNQIKS